MNKNLSILSRYQPELEKINEKLEQVLSNVNGVGRDIKSYAVLSEGKRIRPLLFVLVSKALGFNSLEIYEQSTVYELIHTASLMHDDVLDNADLRRNKPTVNSIWGNHMAVLCGDNLYLTALEIALRTKNLEYVRMLIESVKEMTEGQILELENFMNLELTKEVYLKIITKKTGSLIAAACKGAAILGNANQELRTRLYHAGMYMGTAFQMVDDLLDITGRTQELGKEIGKDLMEGKVTLPLIYLLERLEGRHSSWFKSALKEGISKEFVREISTKIVDQGIREKVLEEARELSQKAKAILETLPPSPEKEGLLELNSFIVVRRY